MIVIAAGCGGSWTEQRVHPLPPQVREDIANSPTPYLATYRASDLRLVVNLAPAICRKIETRATETETITHGASPVGGGLMWMGGGAGAIAFGGYGWEHARTLPDQCIAGDSNCVSKHDARTASVEIGVLGVAALGYGVTRLFRHPSVSTTTRRSPPVSRVVAQYACDVPVGDVPVTLALPRRRPISTRTDAAGNATFEISESDALGILFIELGRVAVAGRDAGRVALDEVVLPAYRRARRAWSPDALDPVTPTKLTGDQRVAWALIACGMSGLPEDQFMDHCKQKLGTAMCSIARQTLIDGRLDPRVLLQDILLDALTENSPLLKGLLSYAQLQQCMAAFQVPPR